MKCKIAHGTRGRARKGFMSKLIYEKESYAILGACFAVYKDKGNGFLEPVYQECLEIEFEFQQIPFNAQRELRLQYRGRTLKQTYVPDFVCYEKIVLEIKAVSKLTDEHRSQLLNYLHATGFKLGLLVNFGHYPKVEHERIILTDARQAKKDLRFGQSDANREEKVSF